MVLASSEDVAARLGRDLTDDETDRVTGLIDEAAVLVESWMRCVPDPVPDAVRIVVSRMVARALGAPTTDSGMSMATATMGPFAINQRYTPDATSGGVWLTRQDKTTLRPHGCRGRVVNVPTS